MTIKEAIKQRHMVRKYTDKKIPVDLVELLNARIEENNKKYGLNLKLVIGNADGVAGIARDGVASSFSIASAKKF